MSLWFNRQLEGALKSFADQTKRRKEAENYFGLEGTQQSLDLLGRQPDNGGNTLNDYLGTARQAATSVAVDGDPNRTQSFSAASKDPIVDPQILDESLTPGTTGGGGGIVAQPGGPTTDPRSDPGYEGDDDPYGQEGGDAYVGGQPGTGLGTGTGNQSGDADADLDSGPSVDPQDPYGTRRLDPPPGDGSEGSAPPEEPPTTDPGTDPGTGDTGEEAPDAGLSGLADFLVARLNSPGPYSDDEITALREQQRRELAMEREIAMGNLATSAARRGVYYGSPLTSGEGALDAQLMQQREIWENDLTDQIVRAREARTEGTLAHALNFLNMAGEEKRAKDALGLAMTQLMLGSGIDPNSALGAMLGFGGGDQGGLFSPELQALLGQYFSDWRNDQGGGSGSSGGE